MLSKYLADATVCLRDLSERKRKGGGWEAGSSHSEDSGFSHWGGGCLTLCIQMTAGCTSWSKFGIFMSFQPNEDTPMARDIVLSSLWNVLKAKQSPLGWMNFPRTYLRGSFSRVMEVTVTIMRHIPIICHPPRQMLSPYSPLTWPQPCKADFLCPERLLACP